MRCLSLWRPWPYWIAMSLKTIETRPRFKLPEWLVSQRLAIHAAQRIDETAVERIYAETGVRVRVPREYADMPTGLICHTLVEAVRWLNNLLHARAALCECQGRAGICLTDVVRLDPPVPYRGAQGFFNVPDHLLGLEG